MEPYLPYALAIAAYFTSIGQVQCQTSEKKHGYAPVNGLKMYYEIHGTAGTPLVLLHGGGSSIETTFGKILPALARSRQVIAFEQQGHGRTADVADRPFTFEQSADDAAALLAHLKINQADLFGFSNGGHIAMQVAIRHPKVVRKLVLASAGFKRDGHPPELWEFMKQAKLETMPKALRDEYVKLSPHPEKLPTFFEKSAKRMREFKDFPLEDIRSIKAPTFVMIGDADNVRPEHAVEMFRLLPHGKLAVLPGGHGAYIGEVTAARLEGSKVQFGDAKKESKLPGLAVAMIEEFLDAPMPEDNAPPFKITTKRENDRVEVKTEKDKTEFVVKSPFGISQAVIERTGEKWPDAVVLRLHLKGLENFRVTNANVKLEAAVSSQDGKVRLWKDGKQDAPLDAKSPYWMDVRMVGGDGKPAKAIPLKDGYFEMALPKAFFEGNPKAMTVNWIDFYR